MIAVQFVRYRREMGQEEEEKQDEYDSDSGSELELGTI
jgi:hypothetical protein